jgi:molybdopterin-guanine dinucleotide biosynthesis protein A
MSIDAYILIGGRSSRLGRDKAFVEISGESLAERAMNTVRRSNIATKIVFVAGGEAQFAIEAARLDAPIIFDLFPGRGPLGGLHAALSDTRAEWILLLACDYPLITPGLLSLLSEKRSDEFGAIVPEQHDGRLQPLCALYNVKAALPVVEAIIQRPRLSPPMHEIAAVLNPRIVKPYEFASLPAACFLNANTEEDLQRAREIERKLSGSGVI